MGSSLTFIFTEHGFRTWNVGCKTKRLSVTTRLLHFLICFLLSDVVSAGVAASIWQLQDETPLMHAARDGDIYKAQELLSKGHNVNEKTKRSYATPLIFAASAGKVEMVKLLLKHGADPNLCTWGDVCPIWWATQSGSYETVKTLIEAGADVKKYPNVGSTIEASTLHIAVFTGQSDIVRLLLDHGIEIDNTESLSDETALAAAVRIGKANIAQILIERGADLGAVTEVPYSDGRTALGIAKKKGHTAAVEVVENALKSGKYKHPKYTIDSIIDKLYHDPTFDLAAQDKDQTQFLRKQTKETLRRLRNTIFARKNYQFDDPHLTEYFRKRFPSYKPAVRKYDLSDIDKRNVEYMKMIEIKMKEDRAAEAAAG